MVGRIWPAEGDLSSPLFLHQWNVPFAIPSTVEKKLTNNIYQYCIFSETARYLWCSHKKCTNNIKLEIFTASVWKRLNAFYCYRSWRPKPVIWWVSFIFARPLSTFNLERLLSDANWNYNFTTINASAWNSRNVPFQTCTLSATAAVHFNTVTECFLVT